MSENAKPGEITNPLASAIVDGAPTAAAPTPSAKPAAPEKQYSQAELDQLFKDAGKRGAIYGLLHFDAYGRDKEVIRNALVELVGRLQAEKGATRVIAVPFLISSHSEVYRQYEYMLGLRPDPGFTEKDMALMSAAMAQAGSAPQAPWLSASGAPDVGSSATGQVPLALTTAGKMTKLFWAHDEIVWASKTGGLREK